MNNNIIAVIIMAAGILGCLRGASQAFRIACLILIGTILFAVSLIASSDGNSGPLLGLAGFVGAFVFVVLFRKFR